MMMNTKPFPNNTNCRAVIRGFLRLHKLDLVGKNTSSEADVVRDLIDGPWLTLSEAERERVSGLSEDLYSLVDSPSGADHKETDAESNRHIVEGLEARERGEWDRALKLFRKLKDSIPLDLLSFMRGRIWSDAGDPEVAVAFFEHAAKLDPKNPAYMVLHLCTLSIADPTSALKLAREIVGDEERYSPDLVTYAVDIIFKMTRGMDPVEEASTLRTIIPVLKRTLNRLRTSGEEGAERWTIATALTLLAFCHEQLGDSAKAADYLSDGLLLFPGNPDLLVSRGLTLYGISPRASVDFELAIKNGSHVVWPYLFLAHHYLLNNRFDECRVLCDQALRMPISNGLQSELLTLLAISRAELGFPEQLVLASFEQAVEADSTNEEAAHNFAIYRTAIATQMARTSPWVRRSESAFRATNQQLIASDRGTGRNSVRELVSTR